MTLNRRALGWLAFLAPFFYLTYWTANAIAAQRHDVPSIVFAWERHIPFLAWTIVPYWSINVFYALSPFICPAGTVLETHGRRLLTAQIIAVACFMLFPLACTLQQPATHGLAGVLFAALGRFDKPFNQAPSLHIALLVILWPLYTNQPARPWRWLLHVWFVLVGASVLTTYQHHFFDVPTGALVGALCLWLWPDRAPSPLATASLSADRRRLTIAACYLIGGGVVAALGLWVGGAGWWLFWPTVSLVIVAANYSAIGPEGFQKGPDGRMSLAARLLLAPYLAAAFINSRSWTRREPKPIAIGDGVWLGRMPFGSDAAGFAAVIDLCAELPGAVPTDTCTCIPMLDLVPPPPAQLRDAADRIERGRAAGPVLVCCALGYSRSAATVATWLTTRRLATTASEAIERIQRARPRIVIDARLGAAIAAAAERPA